MKTSSFILAVVVAAFLFMSCEKDDDYNVKHYRGAYIVNEGSFGNNNGSVGFFDTDSNKMYNNVFYRANNRPLGDVVQSISVDDNNAYIVVNGSAKLEIVDLESFEAVTNPLYFNYPRYFLPVGNNEGFLTTGSMEGKIYVINVASFNVVDSVTVGYGPENMLLLNDKVYVVNSGGWGLDSTISVVDIASRTVTDTIVVGEVPVDLVSDADENIWVQCKGYAIYDWSTMALLSETDAKIVKINSSTGEVIKSAVIGKAGDYAYTAVRMAVNKEGTMIYYLTPDGIFAVGKNDQELPLQPLIQGSFYGLEINPATGDIFAFETNFSGSGLLKIYSSAGVLSETFEAGVAPSSGVFF